MGATAGAAGGATLPGFMRAAFAAGPVLDLDFARALPDGVRFRRATAAARTGADGVATEVAPDVPRFETDPADARPLGLLIEGEATNRLRWDSDFTRWKTAGSAGVVPEPGIVAPDGGRGVHRLRIGPLTRVDQGVLQWLELPRGEVLATGSIHLRALDGATAAGPWSVAIFDYATYRQQIASVELDARWVRLSTTFPWYPFDPGAKVFNAAFLRGPSREGVREVLAWGAQYELGTAASSLVRCRGTPATRAADVVTVDLRGLAGAQGAVTLHVPRGAQRGGMLLDAGDLSLGLTLSGHVQAQAGRLSATGAADSAADAVFTVAWSPRGLSVSSGRDDGTMRTRAARVGDPGRLELSATARLLARQDGSQATHRHLLRVVAHRLVPAPDRVAAPDYLPRLYRPTFADEFDDEDVARINENAVATGRAPAWRSRYRHDRFQVINEEKQIYVDPLFRGKAASPLGVQPFAIRDGALAITAARADPMRVQPHILGRRYTSGCITSELTFWQRYGYFEIRCRVPLGKGFWPAFWLLPKRAAWPPEIDVLEASGERRFSVHQGCVGDKTHPAVWIDGTVDLADGFHVYAVEWSEREIRFSIDGRPSFSQPNFIDEPMYLLANLALGSRDPRWIPDPDETTPLPGRFEIDYIRAFQHSARS
ncbi:MAG: glycoside hydrolase family 16 protein [Alphaproteobacteria bacterium]|nr:glycoside hydrolase family 16 protein [Alphaproteobacteria bacterium]